MASRFPTSQGYSALAQLFGSYPNLGVFRLFKDLNAANLIDLQAELILLERDLQLYERDEKHSSKCPEVDTHTAPISHLKGASRESCPHHERIWKKKLEIRQKLKEYNEAQVHFEHLHIRRKPTQRELQGLRTWLGPLGPGNRFLKGAEYNTWAEDAEGDFACFTGHGTDTDILSRLLEGSFLDWWNDKFGNRTHNSPSTTETALVRGLLGPMSYYSENQVSRVILTINTIFASLVPTVPVFLLYYIESQVARMGAIVVMTLIFNTLLSVLTNAKPSEVFTAATAFTAVQVVFLSTSNGTCN